MASNVVIVESPAKVKTIKKYLGKGYEVLASNGHVRDLPKSRMGIDVENDYEPKYITIRGKGEVLAKLRKETKKADKIYLATDPDREGEAISWHLIKALKLDETDKKVYRISFNEITKKAIKEAIKNPRKIDIDLVDAQQARRILDRVVGYSISPLLWSKIKRGLSAGRVQSVALRMICDREQEISEFIEQEYWSISADLTSDVSKKAMKANFYGKSKKINIDSKKECEKILSEIEGKKYIVKEVKSGEKVKKSPLPFITSTLQQEASKTLNFSTNKTMRIAQSLYEGVEVKGKGTIALITYLRTDSTRISDEAKLVTKEYIASNYGDKYIAYDNKQKNTSKKIQDAHEAIRPVDIMLTPAKLKDSLSKDNFKLYQLIWKRFLASQMKSAIYTNTKVLINVGDYIFTMSGQSLAFDGFMSVYKLDKENEASDEIISKLNIGDELQPQKIDKEQHFTKPPAHYTEASLVKVLEEQGIGRPSTYSPTISTILGRRYIIKEKKNLYVTELGQIVNEMMVSHFSDIVDKTFTANMELLLDSVGEGNTEWKTIIKDFYPNLEKSVNKAEKELESVKIADEVTDVICENCGKNMVIKYGAYGKFLACPGFPDCKNTKPYLEKIGIPCPLCSKEVVLRKSKKGRIYFGCESNTDCEFISWNKPSIEKCNKCGSYMVEKGKKLVCSSDECKYTKKI